ncbi:MAG: 4-(cytidine 5'-diphospho)-2-C-methyl-D-erythritol kinase [Oscillospiraceae bacterium]|nr:4-(cytidine 5'-diphospho)-2-C-methyl-D-erythritol kinase [Oscillospiraceae bacterium]
MKKITLKAYAKLNMFLDITGRLDNGLHHVLTSMQLIDLADDVQIKASAGEGISIVCNHPAVPADSTNTAVKAAELFMQRIGKQVKAEIAINKKIPLMAGLGGGSADAAAVLRGLNKIADNRFNLQELLEMGAEIGADVPFCIHGGYAFCSGTGATIAQALPDYTCAFVIIKPDFSCSTKEAYALYDKNPLIPHEKGDLFLYNAFEKLYNNPEIEKIKQNLISAGAMGASLTGSGSAVFGVFENKQQAEKAFSGLNYPEMYLALPVKRLEN